MAEVHFFLSRDDELRLVKRMLEYGVLAVDHHYETPTYKSATSVIEYLDARGRGASLFFLLSPSYGRSPLQMSSVRDGPNRGRYYIRQRNGGPTIDFFCPRSYDKDGATYIPSSMLGYYPSFWNTLTNRNEKAPPELRRIFSALGRELRSGAIRIDSGHRWYWATPGAMTLRAEGVRLAGIDEAPLPSLS